MRHFKGLMVQRDMIVLVDECGIDLINPNGNLCTIEKVEAHRFGLMHRAVSVFIFNDKDELLLQKRSPEKYHSAELWTNTCCTHPLPEESPHQTAKRRLYEEMGITATLTEVFTFSYRSNVGNDLIEHEYDHVFFGVSNNDPYPDPTEVSDWKWQDLYSLEQELTTNSEKYSSWLQQCFNKVVKHQLSFANKKM